MTVRSELPGPCPRCGGAMNAGAMLGCCARCLLEMGVESTGATLWPGADLQDSSEGAPLDRGRFVAGTLLGGRYRIVGLLGRGGMGEVYKAEDLKLRQLVALKFLPEALSSNGSVLARFHREVRMARQITHPNVCRVHDIGETPVGNSTAHFLSMEYIDGEDLAVLLGRIGQLSHQKSIELARQLCAGLAAAHDVGMVHRDLKPANVMLDRRGRARITDFGLSGFAEDFRGDEPAGTPAYMAPEQLRGAAATPASDIYALGLLLHEVFTGKRAFDGNDIRALIDQQERNIRPPSSRVRDLDPLVERTILRCLAKQPAERPQSVREVAAGLPDGDPLAEALAAGETPSPEMVAASGRKAGLRPVLAWSLLILIFSVVFVVGWLFNPARPRATAFANSPDVLAHTARAVMNQLGFPGPPADSAYGFQSADDFLLWGTDPNNIAGFDARLAQERPGWIRFWYRESEEPLIPSFMHAIGPFYAAPGLRITDKDPPPSSPRMRSVVLDSQGRLLEFRAVPAAEAALASAPVDWAPLFTMAGVDPRTLLPAQPETPSTTGSDKQEAWTGTWPGQQGTPLRIEAASWRGMPVFFKLFGPWSANRQPRQPVGRETLTAVTIAFVFVGMVAVAVAAWRNVRAGRGDRHGAFRIALFGFFTLMLAWLFGSDHRLDPSELNRYLSALGESLYWCVIAGVAYLALEPFVRQRWPHALISWNRLLEGRFWDPLVGRDVLVGIAFAAALSVARTLALLLDWSPPQLPELNVLQLTRSNSQAIAFILGISFDSVNVPFALFLLFSLFRAALRNQWIAALVWMLLVNVFTNLPDPQMPGVVVVSLFGLLWLLGVLKFGLIAGMSMWFADRVFRAEIMIAPHGWYAERIYLLLAAVAALSLYAFAASLGSRTVFGDAMSRRT